MSNYHDEFDALGDDCFDDSAYDLGSDNWYIYPDDSEPEQDDTLDVMDGSMFHKLAKMRALREEEAKLTSNLIHALRKLYHSSNEAFQERIVNALESEGCYPDYVLFAEEG